MDAEREHYIQTQIARLTRRWIGTCSVLGAILFLLLGAMDLSAAPEHFKEFFIYRLTAASLLLLLYFLNRLKTAITYQYTIILLGTAISACAIELMILSLGGHQSYYYAGHNLIIIAVLGFIPINLSVALAGVMIVYAVYLVPLFLFDPITNWPYFISSNAFMIATFIIALVWRMLSQKSLLNELNLQYDLAQEKSKLEQLVQERTKELNKSVQWHSSLFENATDGILVLDRNGIIVNANEKACEIHGFSKEALVGVHHSLLEADDNKEKAAERMRQILNGESLVFETAHYRKDGSRIFLEVTSKAIPIGEELFIESFHRDITEKKRIHEHLFQSQKMESIGVLAGGIAHDFNNILAAILGYTELMRKDVESDENEKALGKLTIIENAARKAGKLISQLLGFSRKSEYEIVPLRLNDVVRDTVKLLERVMDKNISVTLKLDDTAPLIEGDINQLEQVIMNLMVNARDAMPGGGVLVITTMCRDVTRGMPDVPPYIRPGRYIVLSVADTGAGIPEEIQNKIFEPFFTTKERGKGTGLGLSLVYGVVKEHKGYTAVQSTLNEGSTFTVYLPASDQVAPVIKKPPPASVRGNETILVVDDEEAVLAFVKESLEANGYKAIAETNPMSAIDVFKKLHRDIALVVTDIVMPLMDGRELIKQVRFIKPETGVLTISGYHEPVEGKEDIAADIFLQKPFDSYALLCAVRRVLDEGSINTTNMRRAAAG